MASGNEILPKKVEITPKSSPYDNLGPKVSMFIKKWTN